MAVKVQDQINNMERHQGHSGDKADYKYYIS